MIKFDYPAFWVYLLINATLPIHTCSQPTSDRSIRASHLSAISFVTQFGKHGNNGENGNQMDQLSAGS